MYKICIFIVIANITLSKNENLFKILNNSLAFKSQLKNNDYSIFQIKNKTDSILESYYLSQIGKSYKKKGDYFNSIKYLNQAIIINRKKSKDSLISNYIEIAAVYKKLRNDFGYKKAVFYLTKALLISRSIDVPKRKKYLIYNNLGNNLKELDSIKKAYKYIKEALKIAKINNDSIKIQISLINLGALFINSVNPQKEKLLLAKNHFKESLLYSDKYLKYAYLNLGILEYMQGHPKKALYYHNKALESLLKISIKSLAFLPTKKQALNSNHKIFILRILFEKYYAWIKYFYQNKKYLQHALETIEISDIILDALIANLTDEKSILFWQQKASSFYLLGVHISEILDNSTKAVYFTEKNKALLLLLNAQNFKWKAQLPKTFLKKKKQYKNEISLLELKIQKKNSDSLQNMLFKKNIFIKMLDDSILKKMPKEQVNITTSIISLKKIQSTISNNTAYISYIWDKTENQYDALFGLLITKNHAKIFKINGLAAFENIVKNFRTAISQPFIKKQDQKEFQKIAFTLFSKLFPIEIQPYIEDKNLIIIPDNDLQNIPFESLITKENSNNYLLQSHKISYAYSISFLKENQILKRNPTIIFSGFAPVSFTYNSLSPLKNSSLEVSEINKIYKSKIYKNKKATKNAFFNEIEKSNIIHLATHADANTQDSPWIAFQNDKLFLHELYTLKTEADLVVLSACNSSLGKISQGEGILSLARGFFYAGANTVVSSLWNVDDKATTNIMVDFYKNLKNNQTKSTALHNAKLKYLKTHSLTEASPYYWSSFVLIGDPGVLQTIDNHTLFYCFLALGTFLLLDMMFYKSQK